MAKMIPIFLKVTDKIKVEMEKGLTFEEAKNKVFKLYKEDLDKIRDTNYIRI